MKFGLALKHVVVGQTIGRLESTGRLFPCMICREVTGWRDVVEPSTPGVPVCSDECLDEWDATRTRSEDSPVQGDMDESSSSSHQPALTPVPEARQPLAGDSANGHQAKEAAEESPHH